MEWEEAIRYLMRNRGAVPLGVRQDERVILPSTTRCAKCTRYVSRCDHEGLCYGCSRRTAVLDPEMGWMADQSGPMVEGRETRKVTTEDEEESAVLLGVLSCVWVYAASVLAWWAIS